MGVKKSNMMALLVLVSFFITAGVGYALIEASTSGVDGTHTVINKKEK